MKFCPRCGNQMRDDMAYCQKCGAKFDGVTSSRLDSKISRMRRYNPVLDASSIDWEYLRTDGNRAAKITLKIDELCEELIGIVEEILEDLPPEQAQYAVREVYSYVLNTCYLMCKEAQKLLADYTGLQEFFNMGDSLVRSGAMSPEVFFDQLIHNDSVYQSVAMAQGSYECERLKGLLNPDIIGDDSEYIKLTKILAQSFNDMMLAYVKRHTDFFTSVGVDFLTQTWDKYMVILEGLPFDVADKLNEYGWIMALDDLEKNHDGARFKREFLKKRDEDKRLLLKADQDRRDRKYWKSHPEQFRLYKANMKRIREYKDGIAAIDSEIDAIEQEVGAYISDKKDIEQEILEKQQAVQRQRNKIFGKRRAEETIMSLNNEIRALNNELNGVNKQILSYKEPLRSKKEDRAAIEHEIRKIQDDNRRLKST